MIKRVIMRMIMVLIENDLKLIKKMYYLEVNLMVRRKLKKFLN